MIITIIYIFFILCDIISTVENFFAPAPSAERGKDIESEILSDSVGLWMQPRIIYFVIQN